ncbi:MAG: hypothetical protein JNM18_07255 [Planctomycetaceae bacterium]|nr:hypothetical protein [Planctomycetaceae bacterium]
MEAEPPQRPSEAESLLPIVTVHPLGEHVFCPRAALLALESAEPEADDEPVLGPKLDWFGDYDERLFAEALHATWGEFRFWLTCLAPALLLIFIVGGLTAWIWGLAVSLPATLIVVQLMECLGRAIEIIRQRAVRQAALPESIDLDAIDARAVNWWTLRKAGFDCIKPQDKNYDPGERLVGKPWRVLVRGAVRIPVILKRGGHDYGRQHVVRSAAYCRLLEECEGARSPLGVVIFAGSYDCVLLPYSPEAQSQLNRALTDFREFLDFIRGGGRLSEPTDRRCRGCHRGKPRRYVRGRSETILQGEVLNPFRTKNRTGVSFHCDCGDRFGWVPRHDDAVALKIADDA